MVRYDRMNHFRNGRLKFVATRSRCQILRLKCTKIDFGLGSAPDPAGELTALPQSPYSWKSASYVSEYLCEVKLEEVLEKISVMPPNYFQQTSVILFGNFKLIRKFTQHLGKP